MPKEEYSLLLGDDVYADLIQYQYDSSRWMNMQPVPAEAIKIRRSSKKIEELCRKGVMLKDDTLTMKKAGMDGIVIAFTATIKGFDQNWYPIMETAGSTNGTTWRCAGPNIFHQARVRAHPSIQRSYRKTWDTIYVTRNNQELGSLYLLRQCLQLWEDEIQKWGCNGLS